MCLLVESIKIENGKICNLYFNNLRFNNARKQVFGAQNFIDLQQVISIPAKLQNGIVKCRVLYKAQIEDIEMAPYVFRPVKSLKIVPHNNAEYTYKAADRGWINELLKQKGACDDILIVKNGFITDTSRANIIFYDGSNWVTPNTFLLNGTQKQLLQSQHLLKEKEIKPEDLTKYQKARAINTFLDLETGDDISIADIVR